MKYSNKILSQTITQLCLAAGIDHIVISPGSRNAALTIGFTEHEDFKNFSIVDERCAAFFALGLAQQLKKPTALICTSGSALLNYFPAVAEAFYSNIPLVIISADRPAHLIEIGDGQTIQQENVFGNHILFNANCIEGSSHQAYNEEIIHDALRTAIHQKGPVHINAPFSEPLYGTTSELMLQPQNMLFRLTSESFEEDLTAFANKWNDAKRKMILVGVLTPGSIEEEFIYKLAEDESVIVLTETTSNLHHPNFFPSIDQLIAPLGEFEFQKLRPELLLTFGGMVVSKKIKVFLRNYAPDEHWHVDSYKAYDTYFALKKHFKTKANVFLKKFLPHVDIVSSSYRIYWQELRKYRLELHKKYLKEIPFSDFKVFSLVIEALPKQLQLQLSNSATIRYSQLFEFDNDQMVFCNRGTSGIDGSTSTAIGAARASELPCVLISGDLSFLYDSNALWNNYIPANFRMIVVNNGGGGIFRILPGAKETSHFNEFFETRHSLSAKHLCSMYGIDYKMANDENTVGTAFEDFFEASEKPMLLEIFTPSEVNDKILLDYFKYIATPN
ncbi:2-succinyl-5-enolpyruvyl-6-hydroxy-3-cyclohexene-1-carboxylic-acid synthase [Ulvibacter antarcticus]|uniref:2-succinyl-5-enolpyruvyl-6-hydroxy-3-cyclohexene-1-carboxylate synthase n=1 Tax=Ulvibacter antarcticus TaxID=442714 RepID=A0A3L9YLL9_9FLAO|nr:2-succinyl-5-enolpyruvyl-6-hydroxy-3-cyclohexene-1-carboxylic-acid synthase [Ulvibacter antarcticus]RMA58908.1 2-succinyl-5-enolpyruvyl-6-hydroxy-3-cyclohexene-1-carboxylate synthase [Ulvibacter antarcticus]